MDVQTILLSVEERDKWRKRLDTLRASLQEVRRRRQGLQRQLKTVKKELAHVAELAEAMVDPGRLRPGGPGHGAQDHHLLPR
jgi:uncharacterized coiled-coil DUF342 family protein